MTTNFNDRFLSVDGTTLLDYRATVSMPPPTPTPTPPTPAPAPEPPAPSLRLLFSPLPTRRKLTLLLPAIIASLISGALSPFMTLIVGQSFAAFAAFPSNPTAHDKQVLLRQVGLSALELIALCVGSIALGSITSCLWIWVGEVNVSLVRQKVYRGVMGKDVGWFDSLGDSEESLGAAGMMSKFSRQTDEIRTASSLTSGQILQHLTTFLTGIIIAFVHSYSLTLIILASLPLFVVFQIISQVLATPQLAKERAHTGTASELINRALSAISTVKAHNAQSHELRAASRVFDMLSSTGTIISIIFGAVSAGQQFTTMSMFVSAFWFGSKLVREGKLGAGDVMTVFWACFVAVTSLAACIPISIALTKGKQAMSELFELFPQSSPTPSPRLPKSKQIQPIPLHISFPSPYSPKPKPKIPGEVTFQNVTFTYPTRGTPALNDISLFFPAGDITFIVGASGSGKSSIAQLILGFYQPQAGSILLDGTPSFAGVGGIGAFTGPGFLLPNASILENLTLGIRGRAVGKDEIERACRVAQVHDFVMDLPNGYETVIGGGEGVSLSGGQMQRLQIARAVLGDFDVLVLDEATSALDPLTRHLTFENLKQARRGKTTIVITHDLKQIDEVDFVYVMQNGCVVEQGYRGDLERSEGAFYEMVHSGVERGEEEEEEEEYEEEYEVEEEEEIGVSRRMRQSMIMRPLTFGAWMMDVAKDLMGAEGGEKRKTVYGDTMKRKSRYSIYGEKRNTVYAEPRNTVRYSRFSMFPAFNPDRNSMQMLNLPKMSALDVAARRQAALDRLENVQVQEKAEPQPLKQESFWGTNYTVFTSIPCKPLLFFGLFVCILSGSMTPLFSFLLARLLFEVSTGARNISLINQFGGMVLGVAALDGALMGLKFFIMETCAMRWVTSVRGEAYSKIMRQDKKFFDSPLHAPARLVQSLMNDGEDARDLVAIVWGQSVIVVAMLSVGLIWALVRGWQLTLVGIAIAPVFGCAMAFQSRLVVKCTVRNKAAREDVARWYFDAISNVKGIRALSYDAAYEKRFDTAVEDAQHAGLKGAFAEGCTYGLALGLIYLSEAALFYVGAVLIANGTYSYLQMVEVLNLVVFTVSIGAQFMAFTERIAKSTQATRDLYTLRDLRTDNTDEAKGYACPVIDGPVSFRNVTFAYPERSDAPVLRNLNLKIRSGECVAIVGSSGSGKSTIAALLQRLYEPASGSISIGPNKVSSMDVRHLRDHISVVSQNPHLFDASVSENIRYGNMSISDDTIRAAAKSANAHEFIEALPQGYDTPLGENASLVSGGQAQRIQIARALARNAGILVLDECTSALDPANRERIVDWVTLGRGGKTVLWITHDVSVMRACERVVVVSEGGVVEEGAYEELVRRKGVFATLARGGEWEV